MMRRLSYCLLMLCLLAACAKETDLPVWDGPVIQMDLFCDDGMQTKAEGDTYEQPGENPYHENDIACVDFFFYPGGATDEPATLHKRFTLSPRARTTAAFSIELTTNEVNNLIFPVYASGGGITECTVFAIVNGPQAALDALDDTSMDGLKTITVTSNFETDNLEYNRRQDLFMMSGLATITLAEGGRTEKVIAQGVVPVSRYACKLTVGIKAKNYTDEHNKVWEPCVEEMRLYLVDGVKIVDLGGEPGEPKRRPRPCPIRNTPCTSSSPGRRVARPTSTRFLTRPATTTTPSPCTCIRRNGRTAYRRETGKSLISNSSSPGSVRRGKPAASRKSTTTRS